MIYLNAHERQIRSKMQWALNKRNTIQDQIFVEGRFPNPEEWKELNALGKIYDNCCELLVKFFAPKPDPYPRFKEPLRART